jgi:hypothetical protein
VCIRTGNLAVRETSEGNAVVDNVRLSSLHPRREPVLGEAVSFDDDGARTHHLITITTSSYRSDFSPREHRTLKAVKNEPCLVDLHSPLRCWHLPLIIPVGPSALRDGRY